MFPARLWHVYVGWGGCTSVWTSSSLALLESLQERRQEAQETCAFHGWVDSVGYCSALLKKIFIEAVRQTVFSFPASSLLQTISFPLLSDHSCSNLPSEVGSRFLFTRRPIWCLVHKWILIWVNDLLKKNDFSCWTRGMTAERPKWYRQHWETGPVEVRSATIRKESQSWPGDKETISSSLDFPHVLFLGRVRPRSSPEWVGCERLSMLLYLQPWNQEGGSGFGRLWKEAKVDYAPWKSIQKMESLLQIGL